MKIVRKNKCIKNNYSNFLLLTSFLKIDIEIIKIYSLL